MNFKFLREISICPQLISDNVFQFTSGLCPLFHNAELLVVNLVLIEILLSRLQDSALHTSRNSFQIHIYTYMISILITFLLSV